MVRISLPKYCVGSFLKKLRGKILSNIKGLYPCLSGCVSMDNGYTVKHAILHVILRAKPEESSVLRLALDPSLKLRMTNGINNIKDRLLTQPDKHDCIYFFLPNSLKGRSFLLDGRLGASSLMSAI